MNKHAIGASIASTALLAAGVAVSAPAASAAPQPRSAAGCVTQGEYDRVHRGMSRVRVHNIFGTAGSAEGGGERTQIRVYQRCGPSGAIRMLSFRQGADDVWRLTDKG
jgi:hypothetical protein